MGDYAPGSRQPCSPSNIAVPTEWKTQNRINFVPAAVLEHSPCKCWKLAISLETERKSIDIDPGSFELGC
jgi:hypothetical protein